jgi:low affinity Fe/Cu permease
MSIKEKISKLLVSIIRGIHQIDSRYYKNIYNPNPKNFDDLTPQYEKEDGNTYSESLLWAIRNQAVKNLALTGPYGSGKSSILKTFEDDHPEFTYLNISLASFEDDIQSDLDIRKRIESSILQQIFYKVSVSKVPFSRFRRIRNTPTWRFILSASWIVLWIMAGAFIFKPQFFNRISWWAAFVKRNGDITLYTSIFLFFIGTILFLSKLFRTYNSTQFKKLNVSNGEVELAQEADTSILNKHLDEILYFFEETSYDVVAIEDLDRFQDPEIFTKLRELNNLINSSSQIHRKVTFVYALKDDVFKDNNRAKFFDFLIPVIPVINSSNSGEKLLKKFEEANKKGKLSDTFISDITLFIVYYGDVDHPISGQIDPGVS